MKITAEMKRKLLSELGRRGGKARAAKHPKSKLREWARKGGRPRKKAGA